MKSAKLSTGESAGTMHGVEDAVDSPYGPQWLEVRGPFFAIRGVRNIRFPRQSFGMLGAAFGPELLCITEANGPVSFVDFIAAKGKWRYRCESGHVMGVAYNEADGLFYGVERGVETGAAMVLRRFPREKGAAVEVCGVESYVDNGFGPGVLIAPTGAVVSLENGVVLRRLAFPEHTVPEACDRKDLLIVARWGGTDSVEKLIGKGEDIHQVDRAGMTPLHLAAGMGRLEMVKKLMEFGAEVGRRNRKGETAADVAERSGFSDVARELGGGCGSA
jgi:hypothetical protein